MTMSDRPANQTRAIAQLKRALTAIDQAGLVICGMDDTLCVYDRADLDDAVDETGGDLHAAQSLLMNEREQGEGIRHRAYRESGGW
jgi:hypothetical protein